MTRPVLSKPARDAMRHMIFAGIRPRDIARAMPVSSVYRVVLRPRKRGASSGPALRLTPTASGTPNEVRS